MPHKGTNCMNQVDIFNEDGSPFRNGICEICKFFRPHHDFGCPNAIDEPLWDDDNEEES